jgi:hypothetical protein
MQIEMLEIFESSEVKEQQNGHDFTVGHFTGAITALSAIFRQDVEFFELVSKFFAEIICNTINFCNFVEG